jgi:hypothetical protein
LSATSSRRSSGRRLLLPLPSPAFRAAHDVAIASSRCSQCGSRCSSSTGTGTSGVDSTGATRLVAFPRAPRARRRAHRGRHPHDYLELRAVRAPALCRAPRAPQRPGARSALHPAIASPRTASSSSRGSRPCGSSRTRSSTRRSFLLRTGARHGSRLDRGGAREGWRTARSALRGPARWIHARARRRRAATDSVSTSDDIRPREAYASCDDCGGDEVARPTRQLGARAADPRPHEPQTLAVTATLPAGGGRSSHANVRPSRCG